MVLAQNLWLNNVGCRNDSHVCFLWTVKGNTLSFLCTVVASLYFSMQLEQMLKESHQNDFCSAAKLRYLTTEQNCFTFEFIVCSLELLNQDIGSFRCQCVI